MRRKKVTAEEFIRVWQTAGTLAEVIAAVGADRVAVSNRAHRYRKMGIMLQKFTLNNGGPMDVAALAKLAAELAPKTEGES